MKLAVIGSNSMIATQAISHLEKDPEFEVIKFDLHGENPIDITKKESVDSMFKSAKYDYVLLFSGFTDVNGAESQRDDKTGICWKLNIEGLKNILNGCKESGAKLIFTSTDFIFDGTAGPYSEQDQRGPDLDRVGWYGITKIEGEKMIENTLDSDSYLILRLSFPYSGINVGKEDFAIKIINLFKDGKLYPMYTDQKITPTFIPDVPAAIIALIKSKASGIYNVASPTVTTPHEFATYLLSKYEGKDGEVEKGLLEPQLNQPSSVPRPLIGGLKTDKIEKLFKPTSWREGIDQAVANFQKN